MVDPIVSEPIFKNIDSQRINSMLMLEKQPIKPIKKRISYVR